MPTSQTIATKLPTASQAPTTTRSPAFDLPTAIPSTSNPEVAISSQNLPSPTSPPISYQNVVVQRLDPFVNGNPRTFGPGFWNSEYKFTFAFNSENSSMQWGSYNIATSTETLALAPETYNNNFWPSRKLWQVSEGQHVIGFFSPSETYVIYSLWERSSINPPVRTDIWLKDSVDGKLLKLQTFGSLNLTIGHANWSGDESKLYFSVNYEGLDEIFVTDVASGETIPLSSLTDFDGISDEIWSQSPDGSTIAVINRNQNLVLAPMNGSMSQVIDSGNALLPSWSSDGQSLFYWWGNSPDDPRHMSELRKYDLKTGNISTLVNDVSLFRGLASLNESDKSSVQFQTGSPYVVSPEEKKLLIWGDSLYWLSFASP